MTKYLRLVGLVMFLAAAAWAMNIPLGFAALVIVSSLLMFGKVILQ